jgi:hypothetical protein
MTYQIDLGSLTKNISIIDVIHEMERQDEEWGNNRSHDPFEWLAILSEESGKFAQSALHTKYDGKEDGNNRMYEEIIHVAAVAIQIADCLVRKEWTWNK